MAQKRISGVYMLVFSGGGFYIGSSQHMPKRFIQHKNHLVNGTHTNTWLQRAYNKYGPPEYRIILICRECDRLMYEQIFLDNLKPRYNISLVAGKVQHSEETRLKQSLAMTGRSPSQETREKIRASLKGRRPPDSLYEAQKLAAEKRREAKTGTKEKRVKTVKGSPEFREKMRQIALDRFRNPETRDRLRARMKEVANDPAVKAVRSQKMKERFRDPEYKARLLEAQNIGRAKKAAKLLQTA